MKKYLHIIIFVFLVIFTYLLFDYYKWPGHFGFPFIVLPAIYTILHIVKTIISLVTKQRDSALISFISVSLFLLIPLKLTYDYYNILIAIIVLFAALLIYIKFRKKVIDNDLAMSKKISTLNILVLINLFLTIIPYKTVWKFLSINDYTTWRQLSWNDFQGTMPTNGTDQEKDAVSSSSLDYRINKVFNYPPAIIVAFFNEKESWKRKRDENNPLVPLEDQFLLLHEQGHFNISEIYARMAKDSIEKCWGKSPDFIESVLKKYRKQQDHQQDIYDSITKHGSDTIEQKIWTSKFKELLK